METTATIIRDQIGSRALWMFGASNIVVGKNDLQFKLGKNASKATHVRVTLDGDDTYTVQFLRVGRSYAVTLLNSQSMLFADQLRDVIGNFTSMHWHM